MHFPYEKRVEAFAWRVCMCVSVCLFVLYSTLFAPVLTCMHIDLYAHDISMPFFIDYLMLLYMYIVDHVV